MGHHVAQILSKLSIKKNLISVEKNDHFVALAARLLYVVIRVKFSYPSTSFLCYTDKHG